LTYPLAGFVELAAERPASGVPVLLRLCEDVRGGGAIGGPAADGIAITGELFADGLLTTARGVIDDELDSAGEGCVGV
jgi:hypothetical protein